MLDTTILLQANAFDSVYQPKKHLLKLFSRWLVAVYGHSRGVSRALQACAKDLDNVAVVAFPEINGNWTKVHLVMGSEILRGFLDKKSSE